MMKKELTIALNYALNKGFQIHPNAFKFLENIDVKSLEKIIKEIVREKTKQNDHKIIFDPTLKITTGEGVKGYNALFASRFNKLKRIISDRPESRMLKSIASVKTIKSDDDMYVCEI